MACVIYRMATGELPIKGNDTMGMLMALALNEVTAPTKLNPEIPQALSDLTMKLLAKDPNQRIGSAKEIVQALKAIERGDSVPVPNDTAVLSPSMLEPRPDSEHQRLLLMAATVLPRADSPMPATTTKSIPDDRTAPRRRAPVLGGVAIAVLLALLGGGILFGAQIFRIVTNQGELVVEVKDPTVEVKIVQNGVIVQDKTSKREFTLTAGKGVIEVLEKDGIKLATKQFELTRGGKTTVTVTFEELAAARKLKPGPVDKKDPQAKIDDDWLKAVAAMPTAQQLKAVADKLQERNLGFNGKMTHIVDKGVVTSLEFLTDNVTDIWPVQALTGLTTLKINSSSYPGSAPAKGEFADLSPLKDMKLTELSFNGTKVSDLSPLKDLKLTILSCGTTNVTDLSPLKNMPLTSLSFGFTKVADLSPLKDMKLTSLACHHTRVTDLTPLKDMKLTKLHFWQTQVADLSPLKGMPLTVLHARETRVSDLTPLRGMPLIDIDCPYRSDRDVAILRSIETLQKIGNKSAAAFWKDMDAAAGSWVQLFNGKDLTGWTREKEGLANWKVDAGAITCSGPHDYLYTARNDFDDFHLRAEVKISDKGNSGIYFRTDKPLNIMSDYEAQINSTHKDPLKTGSLYHLVDVKDILVPAGSWFTYEIIAQGSRIRLLVNGKETADYTEKRPNRRTKGHIALQLMAGTVHFRKIEIKGPATSEDDFPGLVAAMSAKDQVKAVADKLKDLNPDFDGKVTPRYEGNVVTGLTFLTDNVTDISPVRALTGLQSFSCGGTGYEKGQLADLSPLKKLKLTSLYCRFNLKVTDLSPLQEMKLTELWCDGTRVSDLSPLRDMKLTNVGLNATRVTDLSPLKGMPLFHLALWNTRVSDLSPLKNMPLTRLSCSNTNVSDLMPLSGMPLVHLECRPRSDRDVAIVRSIKTVKTINQKPAAEFWKDMDARQTAFDAWLKQVAAMPSKEQVKAVADKLKERNPGFDGKVTPKYDGDVVMELQFLADRVTDLSPVRALTELRTLDCRGSRTEQGKRAPLADLSPLKGMKLTKLLCHNTNVSDLTPLKDMKLTTLVFSATNVTDLAPLKGMPLTTLEGWQTPVSDLSPLKGMPLTLLGISHTKVFDLSPLRGMPLLEFDGPFKSDRDAEMLRSIKTLTKINKKSAAEFWKEVDALPAFADWVKAVAAMPAKEQVKAVADKLKERNPDFNGKVTPKYEGNVVTDLQFFTDNVTDILPVQALPGLRTLLIGGSGKYWQERNGKLADLSPLMGMKLLHLGIAGTHVSDLSPLQEMKLESLHFSYTLVSDLMPLKNMPLTRLEFFNTQVSDLSPLKDMKLTYLNCAVTQVSDLSPLKGMPLTYLLADMLIRLSDLSPLAGMPLTSLSIGGQPKFVIPVTDLSPLKGMPLTRLHIRDTRVSDLSPLKNMQTLTYLDCEKTRVADLTPLAGLPLKHLECSFNPARDTDLLRSLMTLEKINQRPAVEFWNEVNLQQAAFDAWLKLVAAMPADKQVKAVGEKLQERNPGFDGKIVSYKIDQAAVVTQVKFFTDNVTDISPVRALPGLTDLDCPGTAWRKGKLVDLWPLKDLKLTYLNIRFTMVSDLWPLKEMKLTRLHCDRARVNDLSPLKNMALTTLYCWDTAVSDLSPLKGMPLTQLSIAQTRVTDLSLLKNMPLTILHCQATKVTDLTPLRGMPLIEFQGPFKADRDAEILRSIITLKTINKKSAAEFWKDVDAQQAAFEAWLKPVAAMPAQKQAGAVGEKLKESNPGYDGTTFPTVDYKAGVVTGFEVRSDKIFDISPVRALTGLQMFKCAGTRVADLSALKGMKLTSLDCSSTPVTDLSPLKGMPLTVLKCHETLVADLSPLQGMPLKEIQCDFKGERDAEILRLIKTLQTINQTPAAEFWKDVDGIK